jgi:hypothetical protein
MVSLRTRIHSRERIMQSKVADICYVKCMTISKHVNHHWAHVGSVTRLTHAIMMQALSAELQPSKVAVEGARKLHSA